MARRDDSVWTPEPTRHVRVSHPRQHRKSDALPGVRSVDYTPVPTTTSAVVAGSGVAAPKKRRPKAARTAEYPHTARDLVDFTFEPLRPDYENFIVVSFVDMSRAPALRQYFFNCLTAYCTGEINHVEISFPASNSTISATLEAGSYGRENKEFFSYYQHLVLEVGKTAENAARADIQHSEPLGRDYDTCGLFDTFTGCCCTCADSDRQTCIRMVTQLLVSGGVLDAETERAITTPQQLYDYIDGGDMQRADPSAGIGVWKLVYFSEKRAIEISKQVDGVYTSTESRRVRKPFK